MIRNFTENDLPILIKIARQSFAPIFAALKELYGEEFFNIVYPDPPQSRADLLEYQAKNHPEWILVAERNRKIAGFVTFSCNIENHLGVLNINAVDKSSGEKGVGQELYQAAFEVMKQNGMTSVQVTTGDDDSHLPARLAYERAGFKLCTKSVVYMKKLM